MCIVIHKPGNDNYIHKLNIAYILLISYWYTNMEQVDEHHFSDWYSLAQSQWKDTITSLTSINEVIMKPFNQVIKYWKLHLTKLSII